MMHLLKLKLLFILLSSSSWGVVLFAEITDVDAASRSQTLGGTLGGVGWTATITGTTNFDFPNTAHTVDNTSSTFNSSFYSVGPAGANAIPPNNLDQIRAAIRNTTQTATLTFSFNESIQDLVFHFFNVDRGSWTLSEINGSTANLSATLLSSNANMTNTDGLTVTATNTIRDINANTASDTGGAGDISGDGSVSISNVTNSIDSVTFALNSPGNANDGYGFLFSGRVVSQQIPEPSSVCLLGLGGMAFLMRRKRRA